MHRWTVPALGTVSPGRGAGVSAVPDGTAAPTRLPTPFSLSVWDLRRLGWLGALPLPHRAKSEPPKGWTGGKAGDRWPSGADVTEWLEDARWGNVGVRLPDGVVGIDVDNYVKPDGTHKRGVETMAALAGQWGPLPPSWRVTSREDALNGVRLYRVPPGLKWPGQLGPGVDVIQVGHRYLVVPPSVHPDTGMTYRCVAPDGVVGTLPPPGDLPELPDSWVAGVTRGVLAGEYVSTDTSVEEYLAALRPGDRCPPVARLAERLREAVRSDNRHDAVRDLVMALIGAGAEGHRGVRWVLGEVTEQFAERLASSRGSKRAAEAEFGRLLDGAVEKIGARPPGLDSCSCELPELHVPDDAPKHEPPPAREEHADGTIVTRSPSGRALVLTPASAIRPKRVHWIWDGRWALGTLALLAGREGLGKSTLAYWAAARITRGELPGEFRGARRAVLVCATEDSWEHTIVPRLMAAGADLGLVYRVEVVDADEIHVGLSLPRDLAKVEETALATGAGMLLLDPLMSRLDASLDTHRDGETRRALEPLAALADRASLVVLGLIHLNKSGGADPLNSVMGSKAFTAVARSVSFVVSDPDDESEQRRLFGTPKNNLGRTNLPTLAFTTVSHAIETDEGPTHVGRVEWGEDSQLSIGDAMSSAGEDPEVRSAQADAAEWLTDYLTRSGGSADSKVAKDAARAAGHSERTLQRARRALKLRVVTMGSPPRSTWLLPLCATSPDAVQLPSVPTAAESSVPSPWGGGTDGTVGIIAGQSVSAPGGGTIIRANCANCAKPSRMCACAPARDTSARGGAQ